MKMQVGTRYAGGLGKKVLLLLLGFVLMFCSGASADLFLKFDGIDGECKTVGYEYWSEISSVRWGVVQAIGGSQGGGRLLWENLTWSQVSDKSVIGLFDAITDTAGGKHIEKAEVDFTAGSMHFAYFKMEFGDVLLSNLEVIGTSDSRQTLNGAFDYGTIKLTYTEMHKDGSAGPSTSAFYDVASGVGSPGSLVYLYALGSSGPPVIAPIPAAWLLLGSGILGLAAWRRGRKS